MGLDRRGFITFAVGGAVGTLFTPFPYKLTDDISIWTQNWPWVPKNVDGPTSYAATTSKLDPAAPGLLIRKVGDRPVKVNGNPDHPLSQGRVSPLAAAEVQLLYSPARVKRPLRRTSDGAYVEVSWDEALAILQEKIGAIQGIEGKLAVISGDANGTVNEILSAFASRAGTSRFFLMPGDMQTAAVALKVMGGNGQFGYDIENSDFVLGVGADFLESWGTVVRNRRAFAATHPHGEEKSAEYLYAGPVENNTAAVADQWLPIKAGSEAFLLLGLANALIQKGATAAAPDFGMFTSFAAKFSYDYVSKQTGVTPKALEDLAVKLSRASRPLVLAGSAFGQGAGATTVIACAAVNMLLKGMNASGGMKVLPDLPTVVDGASSRQAMLQNDLVGYLQSVAEGAADMPEALLIYEANPAYALPAAAQMSETLAKVPFKVCLSQFMHETASMCDLVLPMAMGLERWDDVDTPYGSGGNLLTWSVPVMDKPVFNARHGGDVILELADKLGMNLGFTGFKEVMEAKANAAGADMGALEQGQAWSSTKTGYGYLSLNPDILAKALGGSPTQGDMPLALAPVKALKYGTSESGIPPFSLKAISESELTGRMFYVQMNASTAAKTGVRQGSKVRLTSALGECLALVNINEGVMDDVVAAPLGLGHTALDEYSRGKGDNVCKLMTVVLEPGTGLPTWNGSRVKIELA